MYHTILPHQFQLTHSSILPTCHEDNLKADHILSCLQIQFFHSSSHVSSNISNAIKNNADLVSPLLQYIRLTTSSRPFNSSISKQEPTSDLAYAQNLRTALLYRRIILTSNFMSSIAQFPHLPIYNSIAVSKTSHLSITVKQAHTSAIRTFPQQLFQNDSPATHLQSPPPWTLIQPIIHFNLIEIPASNNNTYIRNTRSLSDEYPNHTVGLSDGSKSKHESAHDYSIDRFIVSHWIRNTASVFSAKLMAIFSCFTHPS